MPETVDAILQVSVSGSGVDGFRREKNTYPTSQGKQGGEPLTQPQLQLVTVVVFLSGVLPSRASLRHQGGKWGGAVYISPQKVASRESSFHKTQRIHLPFPFKTALSLLLPGSLLAQK